MAICEYCKNEHASDFCPNCGRPLAFWNGSFVFGYSKRQANGADLLLTDKYLIVKYLNPYKEAAGTSASTAAGMGFGLVGGLVAMGVEAGAKAATKKSRASKSFFGYYDLREVQKAIYPCFVGKITKKPYLIKFINQDGSDFALAFQPYKEAAKFADALRQAGVYVEDGSGTVLTTFCDRPFVDKNTFGTRVCHSAGAFVHLNPKQFVVPPILGASAQEQSYQAPMQEQTYQPPVQPEQQYSEPQPEPVYQAPMQEQTYQPPEQPEQQYSEPQPEPVSQAPMQEQTYQPPVQPEPQYSEPMPEPISQAPMQEQAYQPPVQPEPQYSEPMPEQAAQVDPASVKPVRAFCTNCGTPLKEGLVFCTNCGMKMRGIDETDENDKKDENEAIATDLSWQIRETKSLLHTPVFNIIKQHEVAATGIEGDYDAIEAPDWAMVVAVYQDSFVLVRQWRHAAECLSLEFPGGVVDGGENAEDAARRELLEETGFEVGKLTHLGTVSPNPALFKNRFHVYLAEELTPTGTQSLDDDELLTYELMPTDEVIRNYGKGEFAHALMGTALALYQQHQSTAG